MKYFLKINFNFFCLNKMVLFYVNICYWEWVVLLCKFLVLIQQGVRKYLIFVYNVVNLDCKNKFIYLFKLLFFFCVKIFLVLLNLFQLLKICFIYWFIGENFCIQMYVSNNDCYIDLKIVVL